MINIIYIASGGAVGALLRFFFTYFIKFFYPNLPIGTFFVNVLGSLLIGVLIGISENKIGSGNFIKYFMIIGILGSFTTFSSFSFEIIELYNNKRILISLIYIISSIFFCICSSYIGYNFTKI